MENEKLYTITNHTDEKLTLIALGVKADGHAQAQVEGSTPAVLSALASLVGYTLTSIRKPALMPREMALAMVVKDILDRWEEEDEEAEDEKPKGEESKSNADASSILSDVFNFMKGEVD